jgi:hypothetical protein
MLLEAAFYIIRAAGIERTVRTFEDVDEVVHLLLHWLTYIVLQKLEQTLAG